LLDVDITSIKRKKATLDSMANVLNEFLHGVSKGFADAAFASFSRRRSTVREDIGQSFGGDEEVAVKPADAVPSAGRAYLDILNSDDSAAAADTKAVAPRKSSSPRGGVVDAKKQPAAKKPAPRPSGGGGLKEI
jgi:hypothetical protein